MKTTNKMSLRVWTNLDDDFDHEQLADNWAKIDAHDHTNGRGVLIPTAGISTEAITEALLDEELQHRIFKATESYSEVAELAPAKPETATGRTLVQATVALSTAETVHIEVVVNSVTIAHLKVITTGAEDYPLNFFVPDAIAWEWKLAAGVEGHVKFTFRTVEL